jgi:PAS domain S-box-containing protein
MNEPLKILILEDSVIDVEIIQRLLVRAGMHCSFHIAMDKNSFLTALEELTLDLIISDNSLPQFDAMEALEITRQQFSHLPFILVTGTVSEEFAADIIRRGADDYILKDRMARLPAAIDAAIKKRKAEKEIIDYSYAIDQSSIVSITDQHGIILYANDNFCKISKYAADELIGRDHRIIDSGHHPKEFMSNLSATIANGEIWKGELKNKAKDGVFYWVDVTIVPFLNEKKKPYQYIEISADITERKEAEEKLASSEKRFRTLIENSFDAIVLNDSDYHILYQSPSVTRILGYKADERMGKQTIDYVHPESHKDYIELYTKLRESPGIPLSFQYQFRHKNGNYIWLEGVVTNLLLDSAVKAYVANYRDVTEKKKAEELLKKNFDEKQALAERVSAILNTLPANIALLDNNGFILDVNGAWKKFADENGFVGSNYCIGYNYLEVSLKSSGMDEEDGNAVARGIEAVLKNEQSDFVYEYPCDAPGFKRWFRMVVTSLKEKAYTGAVVMHIDISELRRLEHERIVNEMEEQKKITKAMLFGQEKERNTIAQELHDNVNQILAGTNLFLSIAKKNPEKSMEHIETSMEGIRSAIEENRKLAHVLITPDFETIQLTEFIHTLTEKMFTPLRINVDINTEHFQEAWLKDEQKLAIYRIAQEQCSNIVKYSGAKSVDISMGMDDGIFTMCIADDGKGMEPVKIVNGIGLKNIKSRLDILNGGTNIITSPGNGFRLEIRMPYET